MQSVDEERRTKANKKSIRNRSINIFLEDSLRPDKNILHSKRQG